LRPWGTTLRRDRQLAPLTTFGIGGEADYFFEPRTLAELQEACRTAHGLGVNVRVLGGGSNVLIADEGVRGAVISMGRFETGAIERRGGRVCVSAGVKLGRLLRRCAAWGLSGLESLAGIPGTVGGAVCMNAGGRAGCIGERVLALELTGTDGRLRRLVAEEIVWGYRTVDIGNALVTYVELELETTPPAAVEARMNQVFQRKRATQPMLQRSAGCFFRNPEGDSAGRLMDAAGLKGTRCGGAEVSSKHANFLVNAGGATAEDVLELVRFVRRAVMRKHNVRLENEVECWV